MNVLAKKDTRVIAIDPTTGGFGFAVMEGPDSPIDWGVKGVGVKISNRNARCLELVSDLITYYRPDVIVVENLIIKASQRSERVQELITAITELPGGQRIRITRFSRLEIRETFSKSGAATKHEIAQAIARQFPEHLGHRLPSFRHPWMSEDYRMAIFDAVSLALTFFDFEAQKQKDPLLALGINSTNHAQQTKSEDSRH